MFGRGTARVSCFAGPLSLLRTAVGAPLGLGVEGRGEERSPGSGWHPLDKAASSVMSFPVASQIPCRGLWLQ